MSIFGFLNIDKPPGMTSHDVVAIVRKGIGDKKIKVGHAGTLDPMATGVLIVCVGHATRLSEYAMHQTKVYKATVHLGVNTTTYDAEGDVVATDERPVSQSEVEAVLPQFRGEIEQVPPMYSAIKQGGKKLYELARQGKTVERPPRQVTIHQLDLHNWNFPTFDLTVGCSAGTYIRSLAYDIGQAVDVGAHLSALRRTQSGYFTADEAVQLDDLRTAFAEKTWPAHLIPVENALIDIPRLDLDAEAVKIVQDGGFIPREEDNTAPLLRAYTADGQLIALMEPHPKYSHYWKPKKVFS